MRLLNSFAALWLSAWLVSFSAFADEHAKLAVKTLPHGEAVTVVSSAPDIVVIKKELQYYVTSGAYEQEIAAVAERAEMVIRGYKPIKGKKPAIVLDIDETSLSNYPQIVGSDFGYNPVSFAEWVQDASALAIGPTLNLYNLAIERGFTVFFITGRKENQRAATEKNLRDAGFTTWEALHLKGDDDHYKFAAQFKAPIRKQITDQGYHIVLSMGDQQSDLSGGFVDYTFKLPNPFYTIP